jgi:putative PIN family toxin of toxin-antitoxin system
VTGVRAVFDCMLFLQAVTNPDGPAFACFRILDEGRLTLCLSPPILAEVRDVLGRPRLRKKFPHLTEDRVEEFLRLAQAAGLVYEDVPELFRYARDPDDEPYINLAIASGADYLVSRDKDLLDLTKDPAFRSQYPEISVIDPVAFLALFGTGAPDQEQGS